MKPAFLLPRSVAAVVRSILVASAVLSLSCGGAGNRISGVGEAEASVERPGAADSSGWYPYPGPVRLDERSDVALEAGPGFSDVLSIGPDLLVRDSFGRLSLYSAELGRFLPWRGPDTERGTAAIVVAIAADSARIYVSQEDGFVHAFPAPSGSGPETEPVKPLWSVHPGMVSDWILAVPERLVCAASDGKIAVLSASEGTVQAFRDLGLPLVGKPVAAGSVLAAARSVGLAALGLPDLEFLWSGDRAPSNLPVLRTVRNLLAFQDHEGILRMLDARTGTELYSISGVQGSALACDGERWYVAGPDDSLGAFGFSDGTPVWTAGAAAERVSLGAGMTRYLPRLAVDSERVYVVHSGGLESWNSRTGELIERSKVPGPVDGLFIAPGRLFCRMRDGTLRAYGPESTQADLLDPQGAIRPDPAVIQRILSQLERYAEPQTAVRLAWRVYVPEAVPSPDNRFTVFRYEVGEAGKKTFSLRPDGQDRMLVAVFDATGEERHANVGELGVDASFEYWTEAGTWYVAVGNLRGQVPEAPVFLDIR
ncbi:MAG TPA: PQQ-binding-like beta-propeller repeat protein [Spirochaetia bacterium]|nr:PQQ-binding-like beta-propeller repeat protein [Spirochaetales bacterium]HRY81428.1 PQQ-binding-like beta-propeller repeat protein [Spirochaetia bacterium]